MAVYDDEKTNTSDSDDLYKTTGIHKDEMRDMEARAQAGAAQDTAQIDDLEKGLAAPSASDKDLPSDHPSREDTVGKGFSSTDNSSSRFSNLKSKFTKKKSIAGLLAGGLVGGGIFGFSILQGPAQFVQFAQFLQKTHLSSNEDFGDDRGFKVLVYALAGNAEDGRLSAVGNKAAKAWESKVLEKTGLKPAYHARTGRFIGWEIENQSKFQDFMGSTSTKTDAKLS